MHALCSHAQTQHADDMIAIHIYFSIFFFSFLKAFSMEFFIIHIWKVEALASVRYTLQNNCPLTSLFFSSFSMISLLLLISCQAFEFSIFFSFFYLHNFVYFPEWFLSERAKENDAFTFFLFRWVKNCGRNEYFSNTHEVRKKKISNAHSTGVDVNRPIKIEKKRTRALLCYTRRLMCIVFLDIVHGGVLPYTLYT